jgi:hypothetical protein
MHNKGHLYAEAMKCRSCKGPCSLFSDLTHNRYTFACTSLGWERGINRFRSSHLPKFVRDRNDRLIQKETRPFRRYRIGVVY